MPAKTKKIEQKFTAKTRYLYRRKHMAFGGGLHEINCTEISDEFVKINGHWFTADTWLQSRELVSVLDPA